MKVFLGLGSNLGDREVMLHRAIEAIDALPCTSVEAVSSMIETEPAGRWDNSPQCGFIGCRATPATDSAGPDSGEMPVGITALPDSAAGSEATQTFGFDAHNPDKRRGKEEGRSSEGTNDVTCGKFLNCCVSISTAIPPHRLLEAVKGIERKQGRQNEGIRKDEKGRRIYSDRPIDIDILLYGKRRINSPDLQVPHPRMLERDFVMRPLREIATKLPEMLQNGRKK